MTPSVPAWVPVLFIGLVFIGYRQSLPRTVKPGVLTGVALAMMGLSFYGVLSAFGAQPLALVCWGLGYAVAVPLGARHFASQGMRSEGASVRVPGSWVPMVLILAIFVAKFVLGFVTGVRSPLLHQAGFIATLSLGLGALSGGFGARALAVHRFATAAAAPGTTTPACAADTAPA